MKKKRAPTKRNRDLLPAVKAAAGTAALPSSYKLVELYLLDASVSRALGPMDTGQLKLDVRFMIGRATSHNNRLIARPTFTIESKNESGVSQVKLYAEFVLTYEFAAPIDDPTSDVAKEFGRTQVLLHAWPYWREFVQSATGRMGLPPLRMPLVFLGDIAVEEAGIVYK